MRLIRREILVYVACFAIAFASTDYYQLLGVERDVDARVWKLGLQLLPLT
jgi:hypothetical protein